MKMTDHEQSMIERENFLGCCKKGYSVLSGSQKVKQRAWTLLSNPTKQVLYGGKKQVVHMTIDK